MTTTIMAETCSICAGSPPKWTERSESQDPEEKPSSWGEIIWDERQFKKEEEDPFNSDNW